MSASTILMLAGALALGLVLLLIASAVALEFSWWALRMLLIHLKSLQPPGGGL